MEFNVRHALAKVVAEFCPIARAAATGRGDLVVVIDLVVVVATGRGGPAMAIGLDVRAIDLVKEAAASKGGPVIDPTDPAAATGPTTVPIASTIGTNGTIGGAITASISPTIGTTTGTTTADGMTAIGGTVTRTWAGDTRTISTFGPTRLGPR